MKTYTEEHRKQAIELYGDLKSYKATAKKLGIPSGTLWSWCNKKQKYEKKGDQVTTQAVYFTTEGTPALNRRAETHDFLDGLRNQITHLEKEVVRLTKTNNALRSTIKLLLDNDDSV